MKKSLLAVAALGAFASAAQAQSSVTVYGVIDMGYVGSNSRFANPGQTVSGVTGSSTGVTSATSSGIASGAESTGRLGFKGTEDLGGGLSAFFTYETKMDPNSSTVLGTGADGNRQSFVGLKKNGIGNFSLGTQYTGIHNAVAATDPGLQNNMMGNVIYDKGTNVYPSLSTASTANQYNGMQNNTSYTVRLTNMLRLESDTFSGFQANAFYVLNNNNANQSSVAATSSGYAASTGTANSSAWGLGGNYTWQKLMVTANYQALYNKQAYAVSNANGQYSLGAPAQGGYAGVATIGTNIRDNQQYYAATYDFGILKAYVQYINRKTSDVNFSSNYLARTAQQIGVRSFITPTVESWASLGTGKLTVSSAGANTNALVNNAASIGSNSANFGAFQLGTNYWLSKRTNLYAIYGQERTSNQNYTLNANPTSYNSNNYALGVRHTF
jgi:predicted porin